MNTEVIVFAGAKGGVGRTTLLVNTAVYLHRRGFGCVVADLDLAHPAAALYLGRENAETIPGERDMGAIHAALANALPPVWCPAAGPGRNAIATARLIEQLVHLKPDVVLADVPAGSNPLALYLFARATRPVLTLVPEAAAVASAYVFLRRAVLARLRAAAASNDTRAWVAALSRVEPPPSALEIRSRAEKHSAAMTEFAAGSLREFRPCLAVNVAGSRESRQLAGEMALVARTLLGIDVDIARAIPDDDAVAGATRRLSPAVLASPEADGAHAIHEFAVELLARPAVSGATVAGAEAAAT